MKPVMVVGIIFIVLGILSFAMPFPHYSHHGFRVGDSHVGVTTEHDEKLPPVIGIVLVVAGAGLMIAGKGA
jgi:uncharacterized membrane protein HdeD (DUF308 family)